MTENKTTVTLSYDWPKYITANQDVTDFCTELFSAAIALFHKEYPSSHKQSADKLVYHFDFDNDKKSTEFVNYMREAIKKFQIGDIVTLSYNNGNIIAENIITEAKEIDLDDIEVSYFDPNKTWYVVFKYNWGEINRTDLNKREIINRSGLYQYLCKHNNLCSKNDLFNKTSSWVAQQQENNKIAYHIYRFELYEQALDAYNCAKSMALLNNAENLMPFYFDIMLLDYNPNDTNGFKVAESLNIKDIKVGIIDFSKPKTLQSLIEEN